MKHRHLTGKYAYRERLAMIPLTCWVQRRLAAYEQRDDIDSAINRLAGELGISQRLLGRWSHQTSDGDVTTFDVVRETVEDALHRAGVPLWEVYPWLANEHDRPVEEGWCAACGENVQLVDGVCAWCDGRVGAAREGPPMRDYEAILRLVDAPLDYEAMLRAAARRPKPRGTPSLYSDKQLAALHLVHVRRGTSINELGRRTFARIGYKNHHSASRAIGVGWKRLGFPARDRVEQVRKTCTTHGLAPKHGPRPGYIRHKRLNGIGAEGARGSYRPVCIGVRTWHPRKGEPCEHPAMFGSDYCLQHDPAREVERHEAMRRMRDHLPARQEALPLYPFSAYLRHLHDELGAWSRVAERIERSIDTARNYANMRRGDKPLTLIGRDTVIDLITNAGGDPSEVYPALYQRRAGAVSSVDA